MRERQIWLVIAGILAAGILITCSNSMMIQKSSSSNGATTGAVPMAAAALGNGEPAAFSGEARDLAENGSGQAQEETAAQTPASPVTGIWGRSKSLPADTQETDYRKRLEDLDEQILKLWGEGAESGTYSRKSAAEAEEKLWDGEIQTILDALTEILSEDEVNDLMEEQQEWEDALEAKAVAKSSQKSSVEPDAAQVAQARAQLARQRAYDLVSRYEDKKA